MWASTSQVIFFFFIYFWKLFFLTKHEGDFSGSNALTDSSTVNTEKLIPKSKVQCYVPSGCR